MDLTHELQDITRNFFQISFPKKIELSDNLSPSESYKKILL